MHAFETVLGRLGSRFSLNFRPASKGRRVYTSPVGRFLDQPLQLALGVRVGAEERALPFAEGVEVFETLEQDITMTSVTFRCMSKALGVAAQFRFVAPFYPEDEALSHAPIFYILANVERIPAKWKDQEPIEGELFLRLQELSGTPGRSGIEVEQQGRSLRIGYVVSVETRNPLGDDRAMMREIECEEFIKLISEGAADGERMELRAPFRIEGPEGTAEAAFVWAAHTPEDLLEARGRKDHVFKYTREFPNAKAVGLWAEGVMTQALEKTEFFDSVISKTSLAKSKQDLIAFTFQSYLSNTWLTLSRSDPEQDWFSVWEGNCKFHSTIDVEYNHGLLYFILWPELLEKTFNEWRHFEKSRTDVDGSFMSHDMGHGFLATKQAYGHDMEVEENCNFILMLYALWRYTGKKVLVEEHYERVKRLIRFIRSSDTTGNGFPNEGVANTIDDASPAVQYAREQSYLAVKSLCAAHAASVMAAEMGDEEFETLCVEIESTIEQTLDANAWLGDHYAVCIDKATDLGKPSSWSSDVEARGDDLAGWDAYSIYTGNGLLYLLMTGCRANLDYSRITSDLVAATKYSLGEYGCFHSSVDHSNMWVSQNLWRDFVGAYLGVDQLDMAERYWAFELFENTSGTEGKGGCFIDTYGWNNLCHYPRGITSIGILYAMAGLSIDRVKGELRINPARRPLRVPIPTFARWTERKIPWIEVSRTGEVKIEGRELLEGLKIKLGQGLRLIE